MHTCWKYSCRFKQSIVRLLFPNKQCNWQPTSYMYTFVHYCIHNVIQQTKTNLINLYLYVSKQGHALIFRVKHLQRRRKINDLLNSLILYVIRILKCSKSLIAVRAELIKPNGHDDLIFFKRWIFPMAVKASFPFPTLL